MRRACLWSSLSSILFCLLLIDLTFLADLLVHRGELRVSGPEQTLLQHLMGEELPSAPPTVNASSIEFHYENRGLLPTVWEDRNRFWGVATAAAWRRCPLLRDNAWALLFLTTLAALLGLANRFADNRAERLHRRFALDVGTRLRRAIHRQTLRLGPSDLEGTQGDHALELFTSDVDRLCGGVVRWADRLGREPFLMSLLLLLLVAVHPILAVQCLIPLGACWFAAQRERRMSGAARRLADALSAQELRLLAESLGKTRLVRGYGMEAFEQEQFQKYLQRFQDKTAAAPIVRRWQQRGLYLAAALCLSLVVMLIGGAVLKSPREVSLAGGLLMAAVLTAGWFPLRRLDELWATHEIAEQAAVRVQAYLNRIPEVGQAVGAKFLQPLSKMLEFESVTYHTSGKRRLLDGLSLKIPAGRQVAVVSTDPLEGLALAYLLPRFIEAQAGRVLIDGEDISWVTLESLRAETVFVGGKDPFLTGTVFENISCGNASFSLPDVTEAAKVAHAHHFILKLPHGYETVIGEHGEQLDAGQSFRLGLARAVLRKPALLIIEEPPDAFDDDAKQLIDDAYKRIAQKRTVIFLPTRLSTLRRVDEIVLIHKGQVEAIAPHPRLVQTSQLYRHWEYLRFNEFRHEVEPG